MRVEARVSRQMDHSVHDFSQGIESWLKACWHGIFLMNNDVATVSLPDLHTALLHSKRWVINLCVSTQFFSDDVVEPRSRTPYLHGTRAEVV